MSSHARGWNARAPRIARRDVLKRMAAAGLAAGAPAFPALAEEGAKASPASGTLAETLARYAADLKYEDLPEDVVRLAKRTILDTIGCAYGGYAAGPSKIAIKLAGDVSGQAAGDGPDAAASGPARSRGLRQRRDDPLSRFQRRLCQPHAWRRPSERHHRGACSPSAELNGRSGRDLITATVLAYEVFCKIADVLRLSRQRHRPFHDHRHGRRGRRRPADGADAGADGAGDRDHGRRQYRDAARAARTRCRTGRRLPRPTPAARRCSRSSSRRRA